MTDMINYQVSDTIKLAVDLDADLTNVQAKEDQYVLHITQTHNKMKGTDTTAVSLVRKEVEKLKHCLIAITSLCKP